MTVRTFQSKPEDPPPPPKIVCVEGCQVEDGGAEEIVSWIRAGGGAARPCDEAERCYVAVTNNGSNNRQRAHIGDWVVRHRNGHFMVIPHRVFGDIYEELPLTALPR